MAIKIRLKTFILQRIIREVLMQNKITKPKSCLIENDDFFYRHPEMYRVKLDDESNENENLDLEIAEDIYKSDRK